MSEFNSDLIDDLARQRVVLFLGAGVSASAKTRAGGRIKGWEAFLSDVNKRAGGAVEKQVSELLDRHDYLLACEILKTHICDTWDREVALEFGQAAEPSRLHEAIVTLDQRIIVTTNFDKLLEMSWESKLGYATHFPTVISKIDANIFSLLKDHAGKYIIKMHGTIDDPTTIVFSRSEYIRMAFGNAVYATFLETMLLNYTFLFIGFSMDDPAVSSLMEMYALRYPKARPHYIMSPAGTADNIIDINKRIRRLIAITYDGSNNHAHLPTLINELSGHVKPRRKEIASTSF
jgi:hypothetical protein